jgi:hypothetical protein
MSGEMSLYTLFNMSGMPQITPSSKVQKCENVFYAVSKNKKCKTVGDSSKEIYIKTILSCSIIYIQHKISLIYEGQVFVVWWKAEMT